MPLKNDSPLKYCPLVSFDDDDTDDGFLDIMDQEVAQVIKHCITESLVIKWVFKNNLSNLHNIMTLIMPHASDYFDIFCGSRFSFKRKRNYIAFK